MLLILGRGSDGRGRHAARGGKHHGIGWGSTTALARTHAPIAARATTAARVMVAAKPEVCAGPPNARAYRSAPCSSCAITGMTVVTARFSNATMKMRANIPIVVHRFSGANTEEARS